MAPCRFFGLIGLLFAVSFRTGIQRFLPGHPPPPWSSGSPSGSTLFIANQILHFGDDFFMFEHFSTFDLGQAFFDLSNKPLVVTHQTLDSLVHQRFGVATLLFRHAVEFRLKLGRKIYLHVVSVKGSNKSVKAIPARIA